MVRGGGANTDLSAAEICATLGPPRERGLLFVGIDVIDGNLTEINGPPTGIAVRGSLPDVAAGFGTRLRRSGPKIIF
jgi:glutathione synthase